MLLGDHSVEKCFEASATVVGAVAAEKCCSETQLQSLVMQVEHGAASVWAKSV